MADTNSDPPNETDPPQVFDNLAIPLVFMRETDVFGSRKPDKQEWIAPVEMFKAIGKRIDSDHIMGIQRVNGLWRVYLDNLEDKVVLMGDGIPLRSKSIPVLSTNPNRLDGEGTIRVRVKNIPLSVDDGVIKRALTLKKLDVISVYRDRLRVDNKLTKCQTGDRIVTVSAISLKEPLPRFMLFDKYSGVVVHPGQKRPEQRKSFKCSKCLQEGHNFVNCPNDWVCTFCNEQGHRRADCNAEVNETNDRSGDRSTDVTDERADETDEQTSDVDDDDKQTSDDDDDDVRDVPVDTGARDHHAPRKVPVRGSPVKSPTRRTRQPVRSADKRQQSMDRFVTPNKTVQISAAGRTPPTPVEELHDKTINSKKVRHEQGHE